MKNMNNIVKALVNGVLSWLLVALVLSLAMCLFLAPKGAQAACEAAINALNFPDSNFRNYVSSSFDKDNSGSLSNAEIEAATLINVNNMRITDLKGVEILTSATMIYCAENYLTSLDVSKNTKLRVLSCRDNQLTSLELYSNPELVTLYCQNNRIQDLYLNDVPLLQNLNCSDNLLTKLNASFHESLTTLNVSNWSRFHVLPTS